MFQDDAPFGGEPPEDYKPPLLPPPGKKFPNKSFVLLSLTPRSLALVDTVIARSADFDRTLADAARVAENPEDTPLAALLPLEAYADLVQAKGALVTYISNLMDKANDPLLNLQRTSKVRFE